MARESDFLDNHKRGRWDNFCKAPNFLPEFRVKFMRHRTSCPNYQIPLEFGLRFSSLNWPQMLWMSFMAIVDFFGTTFHLSELKPQPESHRRKICNTTEVSRIWLGISPEFSVARKIGRGTVTLFEWRRRTKFENKMKIPRLGSN